MNPKDLEKIGLTQGESKVYLALLKLGQTKTGSLIKEAKVSSSKVYKILDRLIEKGLAAHIIKQKTKYFSPMSPKRIIDYIEEKEKKIQKEKQEIKKLLPELEKQHKQENEKAEIYEGFKAVTNLFKNILEELKINQEYFVIGATYKEIPGLRDFFYNHHEQRSKKKIILNMIANQEEKGKLEPTTKKLAKIKYLPKELAPNMEIVIYKERTLIIIWKQNPTGLLIHGKETAENFKQYFKVLWKISKV